MDKIFVYNVSFTVFERACLAYYIRDARLTLSRAINRFYFAFFTKADVFYFVSTFVSRTSLFRSCLGLNIDLRVNQEFLLLAQISPTTAEHLSIFCSILAKYVLAGRSQQKKQRSTAHQTGPL